LELRASSIQSHFHGWEKIVPRFAIYDISSGETLRVAICGDDQVSQIIEAGEGFIEIADQGFPGYVDGEVYRVRPAAPSSNHDWDPAGRGWTLNVQRARAKAWARTKRSRDAAEFGPFSWNGLAFDGDANAQRRINLAVLAAQAALQAGAAWSVEWTLSDNTAVELSAADMLGVAEALGAGIKAAHDRARAIRVQIEAADDEAALGAVPEL
jgi:hypothetical protein